MKASGLLKTDDRRKGSAVFSLAAWKAKKENLSFGLPGCSISKQQQFPFLKLLILHTFYSREVQTAAI